LKSDFTQPQRDVGWLHGIFDHPRREFVNKDANVHTFRHAFYPFPLDRQEKQEYNATTLKLPSL
jgi:hypothetical protein